MARLGIPAAKGPTKRPTFLRSYIQQKGRSFRLQVGFNFFLGMRFGDGEGLAS